MLGPQIAVTLDDHPGAVALGQHFRPRAQEVAQTPDEPLEPGAVEAELGTAELPRAQRDLLLVPAPARGRRDRLGARAPVEPGERHRDAVEVRRSGPPLRSARSSIRARGSRRIITSQSTTLPPPPGAEPGAAVGKCQRPHAEVDVGGEPPIQADLDQAVAAPGGERAEVAERVADRLLELVGEAVGQEDPGHVGLDTLDALRPLAGVASGGAQERHLVRERDVDRHRLRQAHRPPRGVGRQ